MSYSGSTYFFNIPYMKQGDVMYEDEERRKAQIIDGLLYSATLGGSNCIVEDASYTLSNTTSPEAVLVLSELGQNVITAIIGKRIAVLEESVTLYLASGSLYYIYIQTTEDIDFDPTACEVISSTDWTEADGMILLATVDYTGAQAVLNTDTGKTYLTSIQSHIEDSENPHGTTLLQSSLEVTSSLSVKEREVHGVVYETITTNGTTGVVINLDFAPLFASAMSSANAGSFYYTISGNQLTVFNTGSSGVNAVVRIEG